MEIVNERTEEIIKKIICHHVGKNNGIISDGWPGYYWLNNSNDYFHIIHRLGNNDFGRGQSPQVILRLYGLS